MHRVIKKMQTFQEIHFGLPCEQIMNATSVVDGGFERQVMYSIHVTYKINQTNYFCIKLCLYIQSNSCSLSPFIVFCPVFCFGCFLFVLVCVVFCLFCSQTQYHNINKNSITVMKWCRVL